MGVLGARSLLRFSLMSEKATTPQAPRPRFGSIVERESSRLTQLLVDSHTTILRGLSMLAPKARRSRVRWIVAAGFLVVIGVLAADRSSREFFTSRGRDFYRAHTAGAAPAQAPAAAALAATAPAAAAPAEPAAAPAESAAPAVTWPAVQVPTGVVASQSAEPAPAKEAAAPAVVPPTGTRSNRAPKTRGPNRPRAASPQGGS
jgi:hypothetical protein